MQPDTRSGRDATTSTPQDPRIGAWLVIPPTSAVDPALVQRVEALGYRTAARAADGTSLHVRGDRLDLASTPERTVVVVGCTTEPDPARRLSESLDDTGAGPRDTFAVVGHFAAAVADRHGVRIVTDHVGSISVHATDSESSGRHRLFGTDLEDVARLSGNAGFDPVSAREFVLRGAITFPYTIREGVKRLPPASVTTVSGGSMRTDHYWSPAAPDRAPASLAEIASRAREIMRSNLESAMARVDRAMLFYSGGEDCRVLAGLLTATAGGRGHLRATTFLDHPNREQRLARWSARLLGMSLETRFRRPSHYADSITEGLRLTGGGIDLNHNHAMGLVDPGEADLFLDGWTADSYLKGWALEHSLATGVSSIGDLEPRDDIESEVVSRRFRRLKVLEDLRGEEDAPSWMSLWPISDHLDYGNLGVNIRARPSMSPYMFGNFVDSILPVRERQKFDRGLFWPMFGRTMGLAGWVPRSGGQLPALDPRRSRMTTALVRKMFRFEDRILRAMGRFRSQGPWQSEDLSSEGLRTLERSLGREPAPALDGMLQVLPDLVRTAGQRHRLAQLQLAMSAPGS